MNKITVTGIMVAIIAFGIIVWAAQPSNDGDKNDLDPQVNIVTDPISDSNAGLMSEETFFDFGEISMSAGKVKREFRIKNTSDDSVTILKMYTSCMCTTAKLTIDDKEFGPYGMQGHGFIPSINKAIDVGKEAVVEVVFDPAAHGPAGVGRIQRIISIENNAGQPLELMVAATVTP